MNDAMEYNPVSQAESISEDRALVSAAKEDVEAFGRLYDKYYQSIFRYIHHRTLDQALTEDLTSNTFFAALRHIGRYRWKNIPFNSWLYRIATNEIRMHYRRQKSVAESIEYSSLFDSESPEAMEEYALLHQAIMKLKPIYQTVITLRFFEEKTIVEISQITGRKVGTVKSQIHRGIGQLRRTLEQKGILSPERRKEQGNG